MTAPRHWLPTAGAALLLTACSSPGTRVILLPQEDGRPSALIVRTQGGEQTLAQPFQRADVRATAAPVVKSADSAQVRRDHPLLFQLLPAPPQHYTMYFDQGGTMLTEASQQAVGDMLAAALARPGADIVVTGHTDTRGSGPQNDELSRQRAEKVRQMLIERGFPAARIEAVGRGERDLLVPTEDEVDEPRNRYVTVEVR